MAHDMANALEGDRISCSSGFVSTRTTLHSPRKLKRMDHLLSLRHDDESHGTTFGNAGQRFYQQIAATHVPGAIKLGVSALQNETLRGRGSAGQNAGLTFVWSGHTIAPRTSRGRCFISPRRLPDMKEG